MVDLSLVQAQDVPATAKVASHFASRILSGHYLPGDRLPSVRAGARELGVHYLTVAGAYKRLQGDGLVELKGRVGAFVRRKTKTAEYLIVTGAPSLQGNYVATLTGGLLERMRAAGLSGGVRYVERDASQLPFLLDSLRGMIRERALGGAWVVNIAPDWAAKISGLLGAYSIPVVHLSRRPAAPLSAALDTPGAIRAGARLLARAGCGRLAMLAFGAERYEDIAESFVATCEALGIDHRTESMPFAPNAELADFERYGHATATRLMSGRNLPDGLLILDDFIGRGALAALLRMGARVPQDVRVCVHARKGDSFPDVFGLPVSRMEADDAAVAESAFDLMEQAVRGEPIAEPHVRRPLKIIPAEAADAAGGAKPFAGVEAGATAQGGDR